MVSGPVILRSLVLLTAVVSSGLTYLDRWSIRQVYLETQQQSTSSIAGIHKQKPLPRKVRLSPYDGRAAPEHLIKRRLDLSALAL
jgi:hypothetical protein